MGPEASYAPMLLFGSLKAPEVLGYMATGWGLTFIFGEPMSSLAEYKFGAIMEMMPFVLLVQNH